jgi:hypothetical protein
MRTCQLVATGFLALFLVTGSGNTFAAPSGTVGQGNISVYKGGQLADKLTGSNPIEDESLLVCDGTCMIKARGISLIGSSGTKLAVKNDQNLFNLLVDEGRVDFVITDSISKVAFYTPKGQYTVADIMFNASTANTVRGYMEVAADGTAEVGVNEGRMVFSTADGTKTVDSNNKILLAMADVPAEGAAGAGAAGAAAGGAAGMSSGVLIGGGIVVAAVAVGVIAASNDDDDVQSLPAIGQAPSTPPAATPPAPQPPRPGSPAN